MLKNEYIKENVLDSLRSLPLELNTRHNHTEKGWLHISELIYKNL